MFSPSARTLLCILRSPGLLGLHSSPFPIQTCVQHFLSVSIIYFVPFSQQFQALVISACPLSLKPRPPSTSQAVILCPQVPSFWASLALAPPQPLLLDETETPWWFWSWVGNSSLGIVLLFLPSLISDHLPCFKLTIASMASPLTFPNASLRVPRKSECCYSGS